MISTSSGRPLLQLLQLRFDLLNDLVGIGSVADDDDAADNVSLLR